MKQYDTEELRMLEGAIRDEEGAQKWLMENGFRELAEFWEAYGDVEKSFQWLKNNGYVHFAALVNAMSGNEKAKVWLIRHGFATLAAFSDAAEGNQSAVSLLLKTDEKGWVGVAKAIFEYNKKKEKKGFWNIFNFGNPYS